MRAGVLALGLLLVTPVCRVGIDTFALIGYQELLPTPLHAAIHMMVRQCMNTEQAALHVVGWGVADGIVDMDTGEQAYGATIVVSDSSAIVVFERGHWLDSRVISHEMIHVIGGLGLGERTEDPAWRCEMRHAGSLDKRPPLSRDSLRVLAYRLGESRDPQPMQGRQ